MEYKLQHTAIPSIRESLPYTGRFTSKYSGKYFIFIHTFIQVADVHCRASAVHNQTLVGVNETLVGDNQTLVGVNETLVGVNQTLVGDNETLVGVNQTLVGDNETLVGVNQTLVGDNETLVGVNQTLVGTVKNPVQANGIQHLIC
ncbi:MAG: hypothetical protein LBS42_08030 [Tannerella sp.]|jgi:hypothetical protein|nr:hypothetical protein [Tannerella sp.]